MRSGARKVLSWLKSLTETLFSALLIGLFSRPADFRRMLSTGKEIVLLGNGPSLRGDVESNPALGANRDLMCVNNFAFSDQFADLRPSYYVILDPLYWVRELPEAVAAERNRFFTCLKTQVRWPMKLLVPFECRDNRTWQEADLTTNPHINIFFFNRTPISGFKWFRELAYARNLGMPWAQNVLVASTFLCIRFGYRRIYLVGADHSWHEEISVGKDNVLYLKQRHCYDSGDVPLEPVYKPNTNEIFNMYELFAAWSRVFLGHMEVAEYARNCGVEILNASSKSYIDAFERVDVRSL
jgi:hypothetical protein